jgi:glutathione S-transferase
MSQRQTRRKKNAVHYRSNGQSMTKPVLYIFAISHYCEKARWALEYLEIDFALVHLAPGPHVSFARKLGAQRSALPILQAGDQIVQGSAAIISWAEASMPGAEKQLSPGPSREDACNALEQRLDDVLGVHVRRYFYSETLVDHPQTVRRIFTKDLTLLHKALVTAAWGKIRKKMIRLMDLGAEQRLDSRRIVEKELDWLDGLLSDGRRFLVGSAFSRADVAAASLLAPLALPAEHPTYTDITAPPLIAADLEQWKDRPSLKWARDMYASYRR